MLLAAGLTVLATLLATPSAPRDERARVAVVPPAAARPATAASPALVPGPPTAAVKAEARERFDRGLGLYEKGDNAAALAEFKRAFELIPNPVVLYNMGLVYAAMNRPVEAAEALGRFLTEAGERGAAEPRRHARKVRDEQEARIARLLVVVDQPSVIEIDGIEAGRAPMAEPVRLASGAHTVTALAPGYQPARREVTLAGQVTETVTLTLVPTETGTAHLTVTASPLGSEVWLNGKRVGTTPLPGTVAVAPGESRVEVRRAGYRSAARTLRVDSGGSARVELTLEEDPTAPSAARGRLRLQLSAPGTVEVSVDDTVRSFADAGLPLPVGPHRLRVRRGGFDPYEHIVDVAAGHDTTVAVVLTPTPETRARADESARARRTVGWSLVGGGLALVAGGAGYAVLTRNDVSNAQAALDQRLALEAMNTMDNYCYLGPNPMYPGYYQAKGCAAVKTGLQDDVDAAKLKRVVAWSGVGVGALAAGIGTYLLATQERALQDSMAGVASRGPWNGGLSTMLGLSIDGDRTLGTLSGSF